MQRGGDRAGRRHEADLADALDAVRRAGLGLLDEDHLDRRHVLGPDDAEPAQRVERRPAVGVAREVLGERVAEAHVHRAFDLADALQRVHGPADVVRRDDALDRARLAVDDDELRRVAERGWITGFSTPDAIELVQSTRYSPG